MGWHGRCLKERRAVPDPSASRLHLLLVDDDVRSVHQLARMLREDGYEVDVATDGDEARQHLEQRPAPDALVTDMRMPQTGGAALARLARLRYAALPVIVVTSYPNLAVPLERELDPPPVVLTKPLVYDELQSLLQRVRTDRHA